jgi:hypothetical protein
MFFTQIKKSWLRAKYTSVCCCDIASYKASYKSYPSKSLDEGVRPFLRPFTLVSRNCVFVSDKMFIKKEYDVIVGMRGAR